MGKKSKRRGGKRDDERSPNVRNSPSNAVAEMQPVPADPQSINIRVNEILGNVQTLFKVKKTTQLVKIFNAYAERKGVAVTTLQFLYNGAFVGGDDTTGGIGMEDGDQLDCFPRSRESHGVNQLLVEASANDDSSIIALSMAKMEELQLFRGDTVLITGNKGHKTVCIVLDERYERCDDGSVRMNEVVRKNLRVRPGDIVTVSGRYEVPYGKRVRVLPLVEGVTAGLFDAYLTPYFHEAYRPLLQGDVFLVRAKGRPPVEFKVMETEPAEGVLVAPGTAIYCASAADVKSMLNARDRVVTDDADGENFDEYVNLIVRNKTAAGDTGAWVRATERWPRIRKYWPRVRRRICSACGKHTLDLSKPRYLVCGGCGKGRGVGRYCSEACQAEHWPLHRMDCASSSETRRLALENAELRKKDAELRKKNAQLRQLAALIKGGAGA